jgi:hypothetical protein
MVNWLILLASVGQDLEAATLILGYYFNFLCGGGNSSFECVEEFKWLGITLTNQNSIQEEIKSRFKSTEEPLE